MSAPREFKTAVLTRKHPDWRARVAEAVVWWFWLTFIGLVLVGPIPAVGFLVLLMSIAAPCCIVIKTDSRDTLIGLCPHCGSEVKVMAMRAERSGFTCRFCRRRIIAARESFQVL
jgi:hypothetical protein